MDERGKSMNKRKTLAIIMIVALIMTFTVPMEAFAGSTGSVPSAPKITSVTTSGNSVTIKWSKVKSADKYKIYRKATRNEWKYLKTVKKTKANKAKYSDTSKYKLKIKNGKYKVYKKTSVKYWKLLKTLKSRKYVFKGKYNRKYTFAVKAVKGKKTSKYSKSKSIKTAKKDEGDSDIIIGPDKPYEDPKTDAYYDYLTGEGKETGDSVREASLKLYKELAKEDIDSGKNNMVSPLSFLVAMGLLQNGSKGDTLAEIEKTFGYDTGKFNDWYQAWYGMVKSRGGEELKLANSVWFRNNDEALKVNQDYLNMMKEIYDGDIFDKPFDQQTVKEVNKWASDKTDGMVPEIIDQLTEDDMMILMNATCFEGAWDSEYKDDQIKENETFTTEDGKDQKATMLYSGDSEGRYFENEYLTGTFKYYRNGYKIMFMLPKEGKTVSEVIDKLKGDDIHELMSNAGRYDVDLVIPEFKYDYETPNAIESLKKMGIETVFDNVLADLTPMAYRTDGYNLKVGSIVHKTHIELDREGTKAAAVTEISIVKATAVLHEPEKREVRLDRPFIYVISDTLTDTPIFMGTVMNIG